MSVMLLVNTDTNILVPLDYTCPIGTINNHIQTSEPLFYTSTANTVIEYLSFFDSHKYFHELDEIVLNEYSEAILAKMIFIQYGNTYRRIFIVDKNDKTSIENIYNFATTF